MARPDQSMRSKNTDGIERLFFPAAPFPHGIQLIFKKYNYEKMIQNRQTGSGFGIKHASTQGAAQEDAVGAIELPMPTALTDATGLVINSMERTFIETFLTDTLAPTFGEGGGPGTVLKNLFEMGENVGRGSAEGITSAVQSVLADPKKAAGNASDALGSGAKVLSYFMRNTLDSMVPGLGKSLGAAAGAAINPNATLAFEGVNMRSFSLDWTLYPDSAKEAEDIKQIVRFIKRNILPSVQTVFGADSEGGGLDGGFAGNTSSILNRAFLTYPSVVYINLLGVDESAFPRFKPVMIDSIDINYGPSGEVVVAEGGVPQGVKLSISCKEIEIQTAEDFRN